MTTQTWLSFLDHSTDAGFRAWGVEIGVNMALVGMVQTADTGQINWVSVARAGANADAGYEIWRFSDSSLYVKVFYGTGGGTNFPRMRCQVGTGSNGSGTLTGQLSTTSIFTANLAPVALTTNYVSAVCHTAEAFSLSWKENAATTASNQGYLVIGKTVDGTGAATTTGYAVVRHGSITSGGLSKQCVRTVATAETFNDTNQDICIPGAPTVTSAVPGGNTQAYQISGNWPDVRPFPWSCIALVAEAARGVTFSVAMVGTTSRTYRSPGLLVSGAFVAAAYAANTYTVPMVWE